MIPKVLGQDAQRLARKISSTALRTKERPMTKKIKPKTKMKYRITPDAG